MTADHPNDIPAPSDLFTAWNNRPAGYGLVTNYRTDPPTRAYRPLDEIAAHFADSVSIWSRERGWAVENDE
jgi:hypothetical protein